MIRRTRRSPRLHPLDLTARQRQNLFAYIGVAFLGFMIGTRFPLDPIYAGLVMALLFGQKLIPWGNNRDDDDDETDTTVRPMVKNATRPAERTRGDDIDMASHLRWVRRRVGALTMCVTGGV